jgi:thiamine-monophosphate kinase
MQTLGDIGERSAIERIIKRLPGRQDVVVGAGDDCAVVRIGDGTGDDLVLTSDPVVAGIHFDTTAAPRDVGHKAIGRMLSDIAAMGAEPRWALVDIVAPASTPLATLDEIYAGMGALASDSGMAIVGGDMTDGPCLEIHIFGVGAVPAGKAILRSTATAGDHLYVTGYLGGSRLGRHLRVEPRLAAGKWLRDYATAMIDISDGLASELRHLTTLSGVGCDLDMSAIPISEAAASMQGSQTPLEHALNDGEDFELLFTVPAAHAAEILSAWHAAFDLPCTRIGEMTATVGEIRCTEGDGSTTRLPQAGYNHFCEHDSEA